MKKHIIFYVLALMIFSCQEDKININAQGIIVGTVVSKGDNLPIENVKVSTSPATSTVFTNANGVFTISGVNIGTYSVQAKKDELITKFESASVTEGGTTSVVFELEENQSNNVAPETPMLNLPLNNALNVALNVTLEWVVVDADEDDLTYKLEMFNDQNNDVLIVEGLTDSFYELTELDYNTKYFWQITVSDGFNDEVLSAVFNFKTLEFPDNRIFYVRKINGNNVIYSINSAGEEYQLTSLTENSWRPRKAFGIDKIAFLKNNGAQTHLYTMNLDGTNQTQVTSAIPVNGFNLEELDFEWKSNNSQLIYSNFNKLYQVDVTGFGLIELHQTSNGNFITEVDWNEQTQQIAVKTNDNLGYDAEIYIINTTGAVVKTVLQNVNGAVGGIDFNFEGTKLIYAYDDSQIENIEYRQLNSNIYLYDLILDTAQNVSTSKLGGTNDLDPKFSPNESEVIFTNTSNDGVSQKNIVKVEISDVSTRTELVANGSMPDWK